MISAAVCTSARQACTAADAWRTALSQASTAANAHKVSLARWNQAGSDSNACARSKVEMSVTGV